MYTCEKKRTKLTPTAAAGTASGQDAVLAPIAGGERTGAVTAPPHRARDLRTPTAKARERAIALLRHSDQQ